MVEFEAVIGVHTVTARRLDLLVLDVAEALEELVTVFAQMSVVLEIICCSRATCIQVNSRKLSLQS